ncbi:hypothetical protein DL770_011660 [Monosporascus sp. CRB-9-2]|nr:hypothetical protein DL770_011660 [Monosporascus sp. CRB-9-2]
MSGGSILLSEAANTTSPTSIPSLGPDRRPLAQKSLAPRLPEHLESISTSLSTLTLGEPLIPPRYVGRHSEPSALGAYQRVSDGKLEATNPPSIGNARQQRRIHGHGHDEKKMAATMTVAFLFRITSALLTGGRARCIGGNDMNYRAPGLVAM